ncbi:MAG: LamG domain-containing protein, partial [Planctomycetaceae bacterium]|nr:LamG domain-containing protein [Planctomycetaceae bacterium]
RLVYSDPGEQSIADFHSGDAISIEAWVRLSSIAEGQQVYVIGKGRTGNAGQVSNNQNWALRLRGVSGTACASFLFHSVSTPEQTSTTGVAQPATVGEFHRWNSDRGVEPDGAWHHVAVSFQFGAGEDPVAWINGRQSAGSWDMGQKTFTQAPIVDNDEIWIGSSMRGAASASFQGGLDEISVYRRQLTDEEIQQRFVTTRRTADLPEVADGELPHGAVLVEVREGVSAAQPWDTESTRITTRWEQPVAAVSRLPRKYSQGAVITDRTNPSLVRMRSRYVVDGEQALQTNVLIRARTQSRLLLDGNVIAEIHPTAYASDGHQEVPIPPEPLFPEMHPVPTGDQEVLVAVELSPGPHMFDLQSLAGGKNMRVEIGETLIALGSVDQGFRLLHAADESIGLDERSWRTSAVQQEQMIRQVEQSERRRHDDVSAAFWEQRHQIARELNGLPPMDESALLMTSADIDQAIAAALRDKNFIPASRVDDLTFLR